MLKKKKKCVRCAISITLSVKKEDESQVTHLAWTMAPFKRKKENNWALELFKYLYIEMYKPTFIASL